MCDHVCARERCVRVREYWRERKREREREREGEGEGERQEEGEGEGEGEGRTSARASLRTANVVGLRAVVAAEGLAHRLVELQYICTCEIMK